MHTNCKNARCAAFHIRESRGRLRGVEPQCQSARGAHCRNRHPERSAGIWNGLLWITSVSHWLRKQNTPKL
jgi:hypothetical protein